MRSGSGVSASAIRVIRRATRSRSSRGGTLAGWNIVGAADFALEDGELRGESTSGKGFLVSERAFADLVLELEVNIEAAGNSGIQVRSHADGRGTVTGYQIEIDPSERAWSGGLFYEGRDWIQTLEHDPQARAAFRPGEWNRLRIECAGPVIRAWVNGIPTCDYRQAEEKAGVLALQVHDQATRVRWRDLRLWELR